MAHRHCRHNRICAGTTATPIETCHPRRSNAWRPDSCRRNLIAQSLRASKNAEDVMGIKWSLTWVHFASIALNYNQCTSDGTRARRKR